MLGSFAVIVLLALGVYLLVALFAYLPHGIVQARDAAKRRRASKASRR